MFSADELAELYRNDPDQYAVVLNFMAERTRKRIMAANGLSPRLQADFDQDPEPPDWLIEGLIERYAVVVLSGDSGAGKSKLCWSLGAALILGEKWIGRTVTPRIKGAGVVAYIDEENHPSLVKRHMRALGITNESRERLHYFCRVGCSLGSDDWFERAESTLQGTDADLLVIDSASAATSVDIDSNREVVSFFTTVLKPLARLATVIVIHHERKPVQGKRNAAHAMMGARQWGGQADAHFAFSKAGDMQEEMVWLGGGAEGIRRSYPVKLEAPKMREGATSDERLIIGSEHDTDGRLLRMYVASDVEVERGLIVEHVIAALADAPLKRGELADRLGCRPGDGGLGRMLRKLENEGKIRRAPLARWELVRPDDPAQEELATG